MRSGDFNAVEVRCTAHLEYRNTIHLTHKELTTLSPQGLMNEVEKRVRADIAGNMAARIDYEGIDVRFKNVPVPMDEL